MDREPCPERQAEAHLRRFGSNCFRRKHKQHGMHLELPDGACQHVALAPAKPRQTGARTGVRQKAGGEHTHIGALKLPVRGTARCLPIVYSWPVGPRPPAPGAGSPSDRPRPLPCSHLPDGLGFRADGVGFRRAGLSPRRNAHHSGHEVVFRIQSKS